MSGAPSLTGRREKVQKKKGNKEMDDKKPDWKQRGGMKLTALPRGRAVLDMSQVNALNGFEPTLRQLEAKLNRRLRKNKGSAAQLPSSYIPLCSDEMSCKNAAGLLSSFFSPPFSVEA